MYVPKIFNDKKDDNFKRFGLSSNTIYDLALGNFSPGVDSQILKGAIAPSLNAFVGRSQTYKSTMALSLASRALRIYPDSHLIVYDTEYCHESETRILNMGNELSHIKSKNLNDRILLKNKDDWMMDDFFEFLKETAEDRYKRKKELLVETPFINPSNNKNYQTAAPLIVVIDSLSLMQSEAEQSMFKTIKLSDGKNNTIPMLDGKLKSLFLRQLPILASKGNMHIILTAHITEKIEMGPIKSARTLQHMKYGDKLRGTGNGLISLSNNFMENRSVKVMLDHQKECQYPFNNASSDSELSMIQSISTRCKIQESGKQINIISSQNEGLLSNLSNYDYLINNTNQKGFGLNYSPRSSSVKLKPEISISRKNVRKHLENYELNRAVEILAQIIYIKNWWSYSNIPQLSKLNTFTDTEICDKLISNDKLPINDLLNTRSYWTYEKEKRKYMSIIDILGLI